MGGADISVCSNQIIVIASGRQEWSAPLFVFEHSKLFRFSFPLFFAVFA